MTENNNTITKAVVAKVDLGFTVIDGLMLPDGSYAMGASQIAEIFQFDKNQSSRTIKSILGNDFQFDTTKSELHPKAVNILRLDHTPKRTPTRSFFNPQNPAQNFLKNNLENLLTNQKNIDRVVLV